MDVIVPDFNRDRFEGQMNVEERELLYNMIMQKNPKIVVESGTCRGGGSTYYISSALRNLDNGGMLYTVEMFEEFYNYAVNLYTNGALSYLRPWVNFKLGNSGDYFLELGRTLPKVDCLMIDGGHDSILMVYDFATLRHLIPIGGLVMCHDWGTGKCDYLRPILSNEHDYKKIAQAIEFAVFERVGDFHKCS